MTFKAYVVCTKGTYSFLNMMLNLFASHFVMMKGAIINCDTLGTSFHLGTKAQHFLSSKFI